MTSKWLDEEFVWKWDQTIMTGNPMRSEQIDMLLTVMETTCKPDAAVLDVGMGSGQIEEQLLRRMPQATVVGIDYSRPMLDLAARRLGEFQGRIEFIEHDYNDLRSLDLKRGRFDAGICFDVIHHAGSAKKSEILRYFFDELVRGGLLFYGDKVVLDSDDFGDVYKAEWERLESKAVVKSGWDGDRYLDHVTKHKSHSMDIPGQIELVRSCGFKCSCLYSHLDRALFVCKKP